MVCDPSCSSIFSLILNPLLILAHVLLRGFHSTYLCKQFALDFHVSPLRSLLFYEILKKKKKTKSTREAKAFILLSVYFSFREWCRYWIGSQFFQDQRDRYEPSCRT